MWSPDLYGQGERRVRGSREREVAGDQKKKMTSPPLPPNRGLTTLLKIDPNEYEIPKLI
jgi:hypothetical protein